MFEEANHQLSDEKQAQTIKQQQTDLHVVTENGEQCFMWRANQLTYIAQDRQELPLVLASRFGPQAIKLDLSYNSLNSIANIKLFSNLSELILDNNQLEDDHLEFVQNLRLKTLSLNKNKLVDLQKLVKSIKVCFPNLEFLSLIGNPLCPGLYSANFEDISPRLTQPDAMLKSGPATSSVADGRHVLDLGNCTDLSCSLALDGKQTEFSYQKYRYFIIYHLPNLRFLDSSPISNSERDEALRRFYWIESPISEGGLLANNHHSQHARHNNANVGNNSFSLPASDHTSSNLLESQESGFQLTIITSHADEASTGSSQSSSSSSSSSSRGAFSRLSYKYTGKNSEGNRFIRNHDL